MKKMVDKLWLQIQAESVLLNRLKYVIEIT